MQEALDAARGATAKDFEEPKSAKPPHFRNRKPTSNSAITNAAAIAVVPWAFIESPQRLSSSLSMTQLSFQKNLKSRINLVRGHL
jgi:hypothetical protein